MAINAACVWVIHLCLCVCVSCLDLESVMPIWLPANLKDEIHSGL